MLTNQSGTFGPMLRLALPVLLQQLLVMLVGLVDIWLAGRFLQDQHLAAMGLMSYLLWLLPCLFGAVAIGALALIARFVGQGDWEAAVRTTNQALLAGGGLAALVVLAVFCCGDQFIALLRLHEDAAPLAAFYLAVLLPVIPMIMLEQVGIACLRGAGDMLSGFLTMAVVNVVNVAVSASLVTGWGPFPQWGWTGLAVGTAAGYGIGGLIILALLLRGRAGLRLRWRLLQPELPLIRRILKIGIPGGADMVAVVLCHLWFLSVINSLGTLEAAAHGVAIRIESLAYLPGTAFQVAAATLAGQLLGAGDRPRATRSVLMACATGGAVMTAAGVLFYLGADWLTALFVGQQTEQVSELAAPLLRIVAFSMPSLALTMVLTGALRGSGDTRWPLAFTFIGFLGLRIPAAYLLAWPEVPLPLIDLTLPGLGLGVIGAWYAMVADIVLRSLLVVLRFIHGGWQRVPV